MRITTLLYNLYKVQPPQLQPRHAWLDPILQLKNTEFNPQELRECINWIQNHQTIAVPKPVIALLNAYYIQLYKKIVLEVSLHNLTAEHAEILEHKAYLMTLTYLKHKLGLRNKKLIPEINAVKLAKIDPHFHLSSIFTSITP